MAIILDGKRLALSSEEEEKMFEIQLELLREFSSSSSANRGSVSIPGRLRTLKFVPSPEPEAPSPPEKSRTAI